MSNLDKYGPELLEFWKRAVESEVKIEFTERALATALRHRLYRLRGDMGRDKHESYELAKRIVIRIVPVREGDITKWHLIASRADKQFEDALKQLGGRDITPATPDIEI